MRALSPGDTGDKNNMTDTLYYDSHCPLCDKEGARLRDMGGEKLEVIPRDGLCQRMRDDA
jgi:negative regulator of sigma E activity